MAVKRTYRFEKCIAEQEFLFSANTYLWTNILLTDISVLKKYGLRKKMPVKQYTNAIFGSDTLNVIPRFADIICLTDTFETADRLHFIIENDTLSEIRLEPFID
jgi:hypothetical protein